MRASGEEEDDVGSYHIEKEEEEEEEEIAMIWRWRRPIRRRGHRVCANLFSRKPCRDVTIGEHPDQATASFCL